MISGAAGIDYATHGGEVVGGGAKPYVSVRKRMINRKAKMVSHRENPFVIA